MLTPEEKFNKMQELDQKIAEARARVEMEKGTPERGMLVPGMVDYIVEGKNDLYKGYYDALRARQMQEAQMANARDMQEKQLENAIRLAQETRAAQESKIASDNEKAYLSAKNRLEFAKAMLDKANSEGDAVAIMNAQKSVNEAMIEYNDTLKLTGREPQPVSEPSPFDVKNTADYHLGMTKNINSKNNKLEEIIAAQNQIAQFKTKEAINRYADLELEKQKAEKMDKNRAAIQSAIASFNSETGEVPALLNNLGYSSIPSGNGWKLLDPRGNTVSAQKKSSSGSKGPSGLASRIKN